MTADERLSQLGIEPLAPQPPVGAYRYASRHGNLIFLSGHPPFTPAGGVIVGKVGKDLALEDAEAAARLSALGLLATLRSELGSLDRVRRVLKVFGMVNCAPGFNLVTPVIDGCSQLLIDVFGDDVGAHARSAVGMAELPYDIAVEIELVAAVSY